MKYLVTLEVRGLIDIAVDAKSEDAAIEQAKEIACDSVQNTLHCVDVEYTYTTADP